MEVYRSLQTHVPYKQYKELPGTPQEKRKKVSKEVWIQWYLTQ